ncbi:MAG: tRNA pseudouridine(38-40) synthase TruA [Rikenellaceae bacterium]|nr:tRNA pseudouridine(38-40) synthase TruA [Rikenellaceae bacterium]
MRYFLELSYKGTAYHGWQKQENAVSVQGTVENALAKILREEIGITGAGRTDTGVHASYYVAHFDASNFDPRGAEEYGTFVYHLNSVLPPDIAAHSLTRVSDQAHARFDAVMREYRYRIIFHKDIFSRDTAWLLRGGLDTEAMNAAAAKVMEYDDFTTFCKLHSDNKTNICRVDHAVWEQKDEELTFTIRSDRFLRNMVRSLTGTLGDVGRGKMSVEGFGNALAAKDLRMAGNTAPAAGLFLSDIRYPDSVFIRKYN